MRVLVGIGSNVEPRQNVASACQRLARDAELVALSRAWWTPAVGGPPGSPPFLNCVAALDTSRRPVALRRWLQAIELDHRRVRTHDRNAPRTLDLDVLGTSEDGAAWDVAPGLAGQPFHLLPLRDLLPRLVLPDGRTVRQAVEEQALPAQPWADAGQGRLLEGLPTLRR